jgi:hypothetical protein
MLRGKLDHTLQLFRTVAHENAQIHLLVVNQSSTEETLGDEALRFFTEPENVCIAK